MDLNSALGIHKLTTSTYHPSGNGGVERVNHTMAQMLAIVCNEHQNDWDVHLPHVEYAYNNSVSDPFNDWGGRGYYILFPVLGGNTTKIAPTGDIFDQPLGQMR